MCPITGKEQKLERAKRCEDDQLAIASTVDAGYLCCDDQGQLGTETPAWEEMCVTQEAQVLPLAKVVIKANRQALKQRLAPFCDALSTAGCTDWIQE